MKESAQFGLKCKGSVKRISVVVENPHGALTGNSLLKNGKLQKTSESRLLVRTVDRLGCSCTSIDQWDW